MPLNDIRQVKNPIM